MKVYLASDGDSYNRPIVADAASELLRGVFREDKMSVRSALGVTALPLGAPVMLEVTFEVENKEGRIKRPLSLPNDRESLWQIEGAQNCERIID